MTSELILYFCGAAVILTGLIAGVFMTFSDFVMRSLAAARPAAGIEFMQIINRKVYGSLFLGLFMGMAPASLAMAVFAYFFVPGPASPWLTSGAAIYVIGVFLVTMVCNVPMNKRLDAMDPTATEADVYWPVYVSSWTWWNHVRSVAATGSTICFFVAAILLGQA